MKAHALTASIRRSESLMLLGVAGLLIVASLVAFGQAVWLLIPSSQGHGTAQGLISVLDRILLVLMLVELLHTVRISMGSGELRCEPFLIVGLIAAIRRILVVTLQSSALVGTHHVTAEEQSRWIGSMVELMVLGLLVAVMVGAIFVLRRAGVT